MTLDLSSSSSLPTANIFLRPGDQARLDRLVRAVSEELSSVALVSDSDAVLDHYGRMLAEQLRSTAKVAVEIYSPDSTDALMDRFNRILASMSVSEALKAQGSTAPARLLLVYDGRATSVREMQLLARLLKDFPGANTRVALLLHSHAEAGKKIEAFGKRMVRWDVQRLSAEEAQALLSSAAAQGQLPEAEALLAYIGDQDDANRTLQESLQVLARADEALARSLPASPPAARPATAPPAETTLAALSARSPAARAEPAFHESQASPPRVEMDPALAAAALAAGQPKKRLPTILWVAVAALAASAALTFWQRLVVDDPTTRPEPSTAASPPVDTAPAPESSNTPASTPSDTPAVAPEPPAIDSASSPVDSLPGPFTAKTKGLKGPVPVPEDADPAARLAAQSSVSPSAAPAPAPPAVAATPQAAPSASVTPQRPVPAAATGNVPAELKSIPAGFYVQHMSSNERDVVEAFWRRNPSLRQARLVELTRIGAEGPNYVLLSGPFSNLTQARAFINRPGLPKDMWVREASKIRPLLPSSL